MVESVSDVNATIRDLTFVRIACSKLASESHVGVFVFGGKSDEPGDRRLNARP